ncbi:MAG: efflux RND transporter permease subunit [Spirochaetales bacterium]|nr:efflux RND transporter permease subunit [Spirochaetales bacterium]
MTLARRILSRPMTVLITFIIVSIAGFTLTLRLPLELTPEMEMPVLAIWTTYPMASPAEIEENVTETIEEQLINVSGTDEIMSYSADNISLIVMVFDYDIDIADAKDDVRDMLSVAEMFLPEDCENPMIFEFDPNSEPFMTIALTGDQSLGELLTLAEDVIQPRLERINGVAQVDLSGGLTEIVRVDIYQEQLDAYGLTISGVAQMLEIQNMELAAGDIDDGKTSYALSTEGSFETIEELQTTVIGMVPLGQGKMHQIRLQDIADVTLGTEDDNSLILINGQPGIQIEVNKSDQSNMVDVADQIREALPELQANMPHGTELNILGDDSTQVRSTLSQVVSSAIYGVIFAVLVLLVFLRQFKPTLIVAISIPVSLLITIGAMSFAGKSFNMITMTGLVLALGMIVDGSIVIIENIFRYREKGVLMKSAAELGTQEMIGSITGSILTSICVFLPILMFKSELEFVGVMFADMAFTIIVALVSSLLIALVLVPVLAYQVFPISTRKENPLKNPLAIAIDRGIQNALDSIKNGYRRAVSWSLKHRILVILFTIFLLIASVLALPSIGMELIPGSGETSILLEVKLPAGTAVEVTEEVMLQWQSIVEMAVPEYENLIISAGAMSMFGTQESYIGTIEIVLAPAAEREMEDEEIKDILRQYYDMFPDASFEFTTTDMGAQMSGADVTFELKGEDMDQLTETADAIVTFIDKNFPDIQEVYNDQADALPQIELVLDRQKLYNLGLNTATIAAEVRYQIAGNEATTFEVNGNELDVVLQLREEDRNSTLDLDKIFVTSALTGQKIPFSSFGEIKKTTSPIHIVRMDRARTITIEANAKPGAKVNILQDEVEAAVRENIFLPEGVSLNRAGQAEMMADVVDGFKIVLFFAGLLVFGVMVGQFESFKSPFIIFMMIPMLLIGVVFIYLISGDPISMPSLLGIVMLLGLVVNNGIILVDAINLRRKRGETIVDACQNAAAGRLQPVLMTTLTTILAMVPMSFFPGEGTEMVQPMGLTVIGGLTSNTIVTLFLVPVLYVSFNRRLHKKEVAEAGKEAAPPIGPDCLEESESKENN